MITLFQKKILQVFYLNTFYLILEIIYHCEIEQQKIKQFVLEVKKVEGT